MEQLHFIKVTSKYLKYGGQNPKNIVGLTPLGIATSEDKNPKNIYAAYQGHLQICQHTQMSHTNVPEIKFGGLYSIGHGHLAICKMFVTHSAYYFCQP